MTDQLKDIRNIGLMAHIDAGKTTTTERILYYTGKTHRLGEVDEGTATMDWMPQEQERGITITSAATTSFWQDKRINIIDTPGHVDFTVEVERSLRVLDGSVLIICGVGGVEPQSETVWRQSVKHQVPKIFYINKLDRMGADFFTALKSIRDKFTSQAYALQIPIGEESGFHGIIDLLEMKASFYGDNIDDPVEVREVPDEFKKTANEYRNCLLEVLAENNEEILALYLEEKEIPQELIHSTIRSLTVQRNFYPVLLGSSFKNKGVKLLLNAIVRYLPSPIDRGEVIGHSLENDEEIVVKPDIAEPFRALAFKIAYDPYVGRLVYIRIYSGKLSKGQRILNASNGKKEKPGRIFLMHANHQEERQEADAGEIVVLAGLKHARTGDTLTSEYGGLLLEKIEFPDPVISMAIEGKSHTENKKLDETLVRLCEEDPTLRTGRNAETGQRIISGMGELHLEIICDRIKREYNQDVRVGNPQVAYKESIVKDSVESVIVEKNVNNQQVYAEVSLKLIPNQREAGNEVIIPEELKKKFDKDLINAAEEALNSCFSCGYSGIYSIIDTRVEVLSIKLDESNPSPVALSIAVSNAFSKALEKAEPVLLEPVMKLEVHVPEEFNGEVIGDLNSRRGKINDLISHGGEERLIIAEMPLAEMFGYATTLRSLSKGRATYSMEPLRFEIVPKNIEKEILRWKQI